MKLTKKILEEIIRVSLKEINEIEPRFQRTVNDFPTQKVNYISKKMDRVAAKHDMQQRTALAKQTLQNFYDILKRNPDAKHSLSRVISYVNYSLGYPFSATRNKINETQEAENHKYILDVKYNTLVASLETLYEALSDVGEYLKRHEMSVAAAKHKLTNHLHILIDFFLTLYDHDPGEAVQFNKSDDTSSDKKEDFEFSINSVLSNIKEAYEST